MLRLGNAEERFRAELLDEDEANRRLAALRQSSYHIAESAYRCSLMIPRQREVRFFRRWADGDDYRRTLRRVLFSGLLG